MSNPSRFVIKDKVLQEQLDEKGIIVAGVLNTVDFEALKQLFLDTHKEILDAPQEVFYVSVNLKNRAEKEKIDVAVGKLLSPYFNKTFASYKRLVSAFQIKPISIESEVPVHQDWTLTDEEEHFSVTVWIPLCDTTINNGTLYALEGSHRKFKNLRGPGFRYPFTQVGKLIQSRMTPYVFEKGSMVVFYSNLVHYSPPNMSHHYRASAISAIIPSEAPVKLYFRNEQDNCIEVYQVPDDFYLKYEDFLQQKDLRPAGTLLGRLPISEMLPELNERSLADLMR